ncbi:Sec63 domain-containing protein, partial [Catenaria anguillulae PL171]
DALDFVTWTYFFRRIQRNPTYYGLDSPEPEDVSMYLSKMIDEVLTDLHRAGIASYYYMFHQTLEHFLFALRPNPKTATPAKLLDALALAHEYAELPVRHNEDLQNKQLAQDVPFSVTHFPGWDNPHLKAHLLLQAHISRSPLPIVDYVTDTVSVLDQSVRVAQAMLDVAVHKGLADVCVQIVHLLQQIKQAQWITDPNVHQIPTGCKVPKGVGCIAQLLGCSVDQLKGQPKLIKYAANLPLVSVQIRDDVAKGGVQVSLTRTSAFPEYRTNKDTRIHAPKFPKVQYEGWYALLVGPPPEGQADGTGTVREVELRRFQFRERSRMSLNMGAVEKGKGAQLYIMCDGYLGLDQVFDL